MIKRGILPLTILLTILLLLPASAFAQNASQANKSWNSFWTQFSQAINKKDKVAVKRLMAPETDFFSGGGGENRDQWLRLVDRQKYWTNLQESVRSGTKPDVKRNGKPTRITKDGGLIFKFVGGRWRFAGPMGD